MINQDGASHLPLFYVDGQLMQLGDPSNDVSQINFPPFYLLVLLPNAHTFQSSVGVVFFPMLSDSAESENGVHDVDDLQEKSVRLFDKTRKVAFTKMAKAN